MSPANRRPLPPEERRRQASAIGARVRQARVDRGMTQGDVAGNRFSKAYISAIETGHAFPSMPSLQFIADQLGTPPEWFLSSDQKGELAVLPARIRRAWFGDGRIYVELADGRAIGMPISRSHKLSTCRVEQLDGWSVIDAGRAIAWPDIGEEIGVEDFLGMRMLAPHEMGRSVAVNERQDGAGPVVAADRERGDRPSRRPGRYLELTRWLSGQRGAEVSISFADVEKLIGRPLPPSARRYTSPWYSRSNPLARSIVTAGWTASVDMAGERVTCSRR